MKKIITKLDALPKLAKKTKVAAYARVSSGKDAMLHSIVSQVSYYKKLIQNNNDWEFIGVYADEAFTGTKDNRTEFQLLLADCRAGKIDMVITKSISRFARNTVTLLETIRELQAINVDVYFEEQNIHSMSGEGEMVLTFLATFAQEESRSVSENMKWRIKKDFHEGTMWGGRDCYGYKIENKKLIVIPKEAEIIRFVFRLYIEGSGDLKISKILNKKGIKPKYSNKWHWSTVRSILQNSNYTGDLTLQKTYSENHLTKITKINKGEYDKFLIENNHEGIITKETFNEALYLRKKRAAEITKRKSDINYAFKGMIKCGVCGMSYKRKIKPYKEVWVCTNYHKIGKEECSSKQVPDSKIKEAANYILNKAEFAEEYFNSMIESIDVMASNILIFNFKDNSSKDYRWEYDSRKNSWTKEMKEQAKVKALDKLKEVN